MPREQKLAFALIAITMGVVIGLRTPWSRLLSRKASEPLPSRTPEARYRIAPEAAGWHRAIAPVRPKSHELYLDVRLGEDQRFEITVPFLFEPNSEVPKRLLGGGGRTSNACFRIGGEDFLFGQEAPELGWVEEAGAPLKGGPVPGGKPDRTWMAVQEARPSCVQVVQSIEILPGEQTNLYDTALIRYTLINRDEKPHRVGLRVLLDVCVGRNDAPVAHVYFPEADSSGTIGQLKVFSGAERPSYLLFLETGRLDDPNSTVGVLFPGLKNFEAPEKIVYCNLPADPSVWNWPFDLVRKDGNACVVMYWTEREMKPGERRSIAYTYGLGRLGE